MNVSKVYCNDLPYWEDIDPDSPLPSGIGLPYDVVGRNVAWGCTRTYWGMVVL